MTTYTELCSTDGKRQKFQFEDVGSGQTRQRVLVNDVFRIQSQRAPFAVQYQCNEYGSNVCPRIGSGLQKRALKKK